MICNGPPEHVDDCFFAGDVVRARYVDGEWYLAKIERSTENGSYIVSWADGGEEHHFPLGADDLQCVQKCHACKPSNNPGSNDHHFQPGDLVEAQWVDGNWYLATLEQDNGDGTYRLRWGDGVPVDLITGPGLLRRAMGETNSHSASSSADHKEELPSHGAFGVPRCAGRDSGDTFSEESTRASNCKTSTSPTQCAQYPSRLTCCYGVCNCQYYAIGESDSVSEELGTDWSTCDSTHEIDAMYDFPESALCGISDGDGYVQPTVPVLG